MRQSYSYALATLFNLGIAALINALVGRFLGPTAYGVFALSRAATQIFLLLAPLGMDLGLQRFLQERRMQGRSVIGLLRFARRTSLVVTAGALLIVVCGGGRVIETVYDAPGLANAVSISFVAALFIVDALLLSAIGRVSGDMRPYIGWVLVLQPLVRLGCITVAMVYHGSIEAILWANTAATVVTCIGYGLSEKVLAPTDTPQSDHGFGSDIPAFLKTSLWLGTSTFFYGLMRTADTMVLGLFVSVADVGRYFAVSFVAQIVQSLTLAVSQGLGAKVALVRKDKAGVIDRIDQASIQAAPVSLFLFGGIAVFGRDLPVVFGPGFAVSPGVIGFLSLGYLIGGVLGIAGYALSMTGFHRLEGIIIFGGGLLLLSAVTAGAYVGGLEGVAIASFAAITLTNVARLVAVRRLFGRWPLASVIPLGAIPAWLLAEFARSLTLAGSTGDIARFVSGSVLYTGLCAALSCGVIFWRRSRQSGKRRVRPRIVLLSFHFCEYTGRLSLALSQTCAVQTVIDRQKLEREAPRRLVEDVLRLDNLIFYDGRSRLSKLRSMAAITQRLWRFRPSLIIAHETQVTVPTAITMVACLFAPLFLIVHDPAPHRGSDAASVRLRGLRRSLLRRLATRYIVHGPFCERQLRQEVGAVKPVTVVPHGAILIPDVGEFHPPDAGNVLFFGRLEAYKGLPLLFAASDLLAGEVDGFSMTIIGHGFDAAAVGAFAKPRPYVHFTAGYARADAVIDAMQTADVIALPYDEASQSGVLCAAMANGRPVVATAVGDLGDIVDSGNGILTPPGDAAAFAAAIKSLLLDDAWRRRLSQGARDTAATKLDWTAIANDLLAAAEADRR